MVGLITLWALLVPNSDDPRDGYRMKHPFLRSPLPHRRSEGMSDMSEREELVGWDESDVSDVSIKGLVYFKRGS